MEVIIYSLHPRNLVKEEENTQNTRQLLVTRLVNDTEDRVNNHKAPQWVPFFMGNTHKAPQWVPFFMGNTHINKEKLCSYGNF